MAAHKSMIAVCPTGIFFGGAKLSPFQAPGVKPEEGAESHDAPPEGPQGRRRI